MPSEQLLDAYSKVNDDGNPYLGTCTMVVGDGTQRVEFKNGRAKVPASIAHLILRHPNVEIPALGSAGAVAPAIADEPVGDQGDGRVDEEKAAMAARIRELEAALANGARQAQSTDTPPDVEATDSDTAPEGVSEVSPEVLAAIEHLESEGEEVPEPGSEPAPAPAPAREGWEPQTVDGQPRCQAAKGDGSQCANPAREGDACQLPSHQKQLA